MIFKYRYVFRVCYDEDDDRRYFIRFFDKEILGDYLKRKKEEEAFVEFQHPIPREKLRLLQLFRDCTRIISMYFLAKIIYQFLNLTRRLIDQDRSLLPRPRKREKLVSFFFDPTSVSPTLLFEFRIPLWLNSPKDGATIEGRLRGADWFLFWAIPGSQFRRRLAWNSGGGFDFSIDTLPFSIPFHPISIRKNSSRRYISPLRLLFVCLFYESMEMYMCTWRKSA